MNEIRLVVGEKILISFTTLLQNGIYLTVPQGTDILTLLTALHGFTKDYARQRIQTIFLNGLPADNLEQQLFGEKAVVAISAAMPGLAGAIFRKGGAHASLRTETAGDLTDKTSNDQTTIVRLKLFNMIAAERGTDILINGCIIMASALEKFFTYRPSLLEGILQITIDNKKADHPTLISTLQSEEIITLTIGTYHGT